MRSSAMIEKKAVGGLQARVIGALCAALLGSFILYGVGFASSATLHNAAHDGRHSHAFPCH